MSTLKRWLSRLLLALVVFIVGAVAYALAQGRRIVPEPSPDDDELDLVAAFSELRFASTSAALRGGRVTASFGGGILDLSGATLAGGRATLGLQALFGGGQLVVPEDWRVELEVVSVLGGVADVRPARDRADDAPVLTLTGLAMFGGWAVTAPQP